MEQVTFDDFKKLELKIGKILSAEKVEKSDKLLKLEVSFGEEKRQIVSGIAQDYLIEELVNNNFVFIINLEPRKIMGLESQGMILAADVNDAAVLLEPNKEVEPGTSIR